MSIWVVLFIIKQVLAATCPVTTKIIGQIINTIVLIATILFIVLVFVHTNWKMGLVAVGIFFIVPIIVPKINTDNISDAFKLYSLVGSAISPVLLVLMYLSLYNVI